MTTEPDGFVISERTGPFVDLVGPLYTRTINDVVTLALRADEKHLNARGRVHGAVYTGLLDLVMGRNVTASTGRTVVTATLTSSYISSARLGDLMEATATVTHSGRTLAFALGDVSVGGRPVATGTGSFAFVERST